MKQLYLMRHGETLFNVRRKIQGWCDSPLTDNGINQAKAAGELLKGIPFDHYYSSTAERSCDTLEYAVGQVNYTRLKGLKERNFGIFESESEDLHPRKDGHIDFDGTYPVYYGGETSEEVAIRLRTTLEEIMEKEDHNIVLAVSHAGACMGFMSTVIGRENIHKIRMTNCAILKLTYDNHEFNFVEIMTPDI
ncbi:MAG: histidine phosphatase family protein [Erysipelotrichaceae bacterium]|nr:histidine phosphatase family protein [Erysipelotrichaceae bacterium]